MDTAKQSDAESTPYDAAFYDDQSAASLRSARAIAPLVMALLSPRSVVDVGCGVGPWLKAFSELGVEDYLGLDGDYVARDRLLIESSHFRPTDLSLPVTLGRKFDLGVCLEVGEHLPHRSSDTLVEALTALSSCVLFSAALPGQGGTRHVNEQWPAFWQRLFAARGFVRLDPIRPQVWRDRSVEWWYKQNTYLYCHSSVIATNVALQDEAAVAADCPFELVHSDVFGPVTTVRGMARTLLKSTSAKLIRSVGGPE